MRYDILSSVQYICARDDGFMNRGIP